MSIQKYQGENDFNSPDPKNKGGSKSHFKKAIINDFNPIYNMVEKFQSKFNLKFTVPKHESELEIDEKEIKPTNKEGNEEKIKHLTQFQTLLIMENNDIKNGGTYKVISNPLYKKNKDEILMLDQMNKTIEANNKVIKASNFEKKMMILNYDNIENKIKKQYEKEYKLWLLGTGRDEDHMNTPWKRGSLITVEGVREWLDLEVHKRFKVFNYLVKLSLRVPRDLDESYIYYKYIVRGDFNSTMDVTEGDAFFDDFENFMKESSFRKNTHILLHDNDIKVKEKILKDKQKIAKILTKNEWNLNAFQTWYIGLYPEIINKRRVDILKKRIHKNFKKLAQDKVKIRIAKQHFKLGKYDDIAKALGLMTRPTSKHIQKTDDIEKADPSDPRIPGRREKEMMVNQLERSKDSDDGDSDEDALVSFSRAIPVRTKSPKPTSFIPSISTVTSIPPGGGLPAFIPPSSVPPPTIIPPKVPTPPISFATTIGTISTTYVPPTSIPVYVPTMSTTSDDDIDPSSGAISIYSSTTPPISTYTATPPVTIVSPPPSSVYTTPITTTSIYKPPVPSFTPISEYEAPITTSITTASTPITTSTPPITTTKPIYSKLAEEGYEPTVTKKIYEKMPSANTIIPIYETSDIIDITPVTTQPINTIPDPIPYKYDRDGSYKGIDYDKAVELNIDSAILKKVPGFNNLQYNLVVSKVLWDKKIEDVQDNYRLDSFEYLDLFNQMPHDTLVYMRENSGGELYKTEVKEAKQMESNINFFLGKNVKNYEIADVISKYKTNKEKEQVLTWMKIEIGDDAVNQIRNILSGNPTQITNISNVTSEIETIEPEKKKKEKLKKKKNLISHTIGGKLIEKKGEEKSNISIKGVMDAVIQGKITKEEAMKDIEIINDNIKINETNITSENLIETRESERKSKLKEKEKESSKSKRSKSASSKTRNRRNEAINEKRSINNIVIDLEEGKITKEEAISNIESLPAYEKVVPKPEMTNMEKLQLNIKNNKNILEREIALARIQSGDAQTHHAGNMMGLGHRGVDNSNVMEEREEERSRSFKEKELIGSNRKKRSTSASLERKKRRNKELNEKRLSRTYLSSFDNERNTNVSFKYYDKLATEIETRKMISEVSNKKLLKKIKQHEEDKNNMNLEEKYEKDITIKNLINKMNNIEEDNTKYFENVNNKIVKHDEESKLLYQKYLDDFNENKRLDEEHYNKEFEEQLTKQMNDEKELRDKLFFENLADEMDVEDKKYEDFYNKDADLNLQRQDFIEFEEELEFNNAWFGADEYERDQFEEAMSMADKDERERMRQFEEGWNMANEDEREVMRQYDKGFRMDIEEKRRQEEDAFEEYGNYNDEQYDNEMNEHYDVEDQYDKDLEEEEVFINEWNEEVKNERKINKDFDKIMEKFEEDKMNLEIANENARQWLEKLKKSRSQEKNRKKNISDMSKLQNLSEVNKKQLASDMIMLSENIKETGFIYTHRLLNDMGSDRRNMIFALENNQLAYNVNSIWNHYNSLHGKEDNDLAKHYLDSTPEEKLMLMQNLKPSRYKNIMSIIVGNFTKDKQEIFEATKNFKNILELKKELGLGETLKYHSFRDLQNIKDRFKLIIANQTTGNKKMDEMLPKIIDAHTDLTKLTNQIKSIQKRYPTIKMGKQIASIIKNREPIYDRDYHQGIVIGHNIETREPYHDKIYGPETYDFKNEMMSSTGAKIPKKIGVKGGSMFDNPGKKSDFGEAKKTLNFEDPSTWPEKYKNITNMPVEEGPKFDRYKANKSISSIGANVDVNKIREIKKRNAEKNKNK